MRFKKTTKRDPGSSEIHEKIYLLDENGNILARTTLDREPGHTHVETTGAFPNKMGRGTVMMRKVVRDIDKRGDWADLDAAQVAEVPVEKLIQFYERFGFEKDGKSSAMGKVQPMTRKSKKAGKK